MSIICGFLNLNGMTASKEAGKKMMDALRIYPNDAAEEYYSDRLFFGCLHQFITPEAPFDTLPYHDKEQELTLTADAIIDNRSELFEALEINQSERQNTVDGQLILKAYKKWHKDCPKYLTGDYAFAIYDHRKQELFCARDHVGKRTFYYTLGSDFFAFGTLANPILQLHGAGKKLNEEWLAVFLAVPTVTHQLDPIGTVFKNIIQLPPAHSLILNSSKEVKIQKYWDPLKLPKLKFRSDAECDAAFLEIYKEAVRCRMRSIGSVGIMLSGGLDSSSVACLAAGILDEKGECLKAFNALPMEGYKEDLPPGFISDESPYIREMQKQYPNIDVAYCRSEGRNSLADADKFLEMMEQPYKTLENLFWLDNIAETAAKSNCRVLLDGQYGNSSVSFGDFILQAYTLFAHGRFLSLLREISCYSKVNGISRKKCGKYLIECFVPLFVKKSLYKNKKSGMIEEDITIINKDLFNKYHMQKKLHKAGYSAYGYKNYTLAKTRKKILESTIFTQAAIFETKLSLYYGIAKRDPTRDKRVIEFCFRISGNQYFRNGVDRLLIRRSMQGIIPDIVRLNNRIKGIQSADWLQRLSPGWDEIKKELYKALNDDKLEKFVNVRQVAEAIDKTESLTLENLNQGNIRMILTCLILSKFLNKYNFLWGGEQYEERME